MQKPSIAQPLDARTLGALQAMYLRALERYPDEAARLNRGYALAAQGHVALQKDGTASVISGTFADTVYHVGKECVCKDWNRAPHGNCKHRWAKALLKRAYTEQYRVPGATAEPQQPYAFPAYTTFAATYVGQDHPQANGVAHVIDGGFYFLPEDAEDGWDCVYAEVALGPGIEE